MIYDLENITVRELYQSDSFQKYMKLQSMMVGKPFFGRFPAKKLQSLEFGQVAKIKRTVLNPTYEKLIETFNLVFGVKQYQYENANVTDYFYALNYLKKEIISLVEREKKMLNSEPDDMLIMAGVERLNILGEMNTLIKLGKAFGKSPEKISQWPYSLVFAIVLEDKITGEVNKRYHELKYPKRNGHK